MTDAHRSTTPAAHAAHDLTDVAALAARADDLDEKAAAAARRQVADCSACADLLADLVTLQTSLPTTSTPTRPRDFQLTPADAARLHQAGWRRILGFFGSARDGFSRPLAIGFTTLGLVGLLFASVPTFSMGAGGAAQSATELSTVGAAPAPSAAASAAASIEASSSERIGMEAPAGAGGAGPVDSADSGVFSGAEPVVPDITSDLAIRDDASGLSVMFVIAGVLLIAGLGLFGLRWSARRLL